MFWLLAATVLRPRDIPGYSGLMTYLLNSPTWIKAVASVSVSLIVSAAAIYLYYLAWRKFRESVNRV